MKQIIVIGALVIGIVGVTVVSKIVSRESSSKKAIAIITTLSHQALDDARRGFVDRMRTLYGDDLVIMDYNAEGNVQQATIIADQVAKNAHVMGIFAIGTLAAQTSAKAEHTKPIVVAAVSDPSMIGEAHALKNVCGVTDAIDPEYQIATIKKLLPRVTSLALLYSPAEANSSSMVQKLADNARVFGLVPLLVGVHETNQIPAASLHACQKSDAVLIPLDNQLVAAMPMIIKATNHLLCPVIASNESPIHHGATIAFGVDYYKSGQDAAHIMHDVLNEQKPPTAIGFKTPHDVDLFENVAATKAKNLVLSADTMLTIKKLDGSAL